MRTAARVQLRSWTCSVANAQPDTREQSAKLVSVCSSHQNVQHSSKTGDIINWLIFAKCTFSINTKTLI